MRKLSKKISMLMVLAMLVSLFSGVVSASAASSWSFANKTDDVIVAVKETIEMEKNQFADFDLYKDGKAFDTDVYTVKYESSDEDVVWVDAKNGKLRADKFGKAEAGDKATISAQIENKNTGAKTTKSFYIVIAADEEYTLTVTVGDAVLGAETLAAGKDYALTSTVVDGDGEAVEAVVTYTLDGAAIEKLNVKAGEYTVVATATIDGEVIATEKYAIEAVAEVPEIVGAKQISLTAVELKLNNADWAKKLAENNALVKYSYLAGDIEVVSTIKKAELKKDAADTVVVTVFDADPFAADTTYKFGYEGYDCVATIVGAKAVPAYIKVVGGNAPASQTAEIYGTLDVKIYNAQDVDITTDALKAGVLYEVSENSECVVEGNQIYFFETGKSAVVKATLDMGWDDNGNELTDLSATGVYTSVPAWTFTNLTGYAKGTDVANKNLGYANNFKISLSDMDTYLNAKYTSTRFDGYSVTNYIVNAAAVDENGNPDVNYTNHTITYYSTNPSVIMVEELTGKLYPASVGTASIVIKAKNAAWQDIVIGTVVIKVEDFRTLTSFSAKVNDSKLSAHVDFDGALDASGISFTAVDQLGDAYPVDFTFELVNIKGAAAGDWANYITIGNAVDSDWNGSLDKIPVTVNADVSAYIDATKVQAVTLKVTAADTNANWNKKTAQVTFHVKNMTGVGVAKTELVMDTAVDMKLNKNSVDAYDAKIRLVKKDAAGFDLGYQPFTVINSVAQAATGAGAYSLYIQKDSATWAGGQAIDGAFITGNAYDTLVTFNPVSDNAGVITKVAKDSYTVKLYKGNDTKAQYLGSKTLKLTDSTSAITVVVQNTYLDTTTPTADDVAATLKFYRDGKEITGKIASIVGAEMNYVGTVDQRLYVRELTVMVDTTEMHWQLAGQFEEKVKLGQLYTFDFTR